MASFTVRIFSASSSGISISNASSKAMTSSTVSSESAPRSSTKEAFGVTSPSSTPSCSTMICFTFSSTAVGICLSFYLRFCCIKPGSLLHRLCVLLYVLHGILDADDLLCVLIRDLHAKRFLKSHDQFHSIQ